MEIQQKILELIFPKGVFNWFTLVNGTVDSDDIRITLEEKDDPPITPNQKVMARKFHDITITDFPIRGRRTLLTLEEDIGRSKANRNISKETSIYLFPGLNFKKNLLIF